MDPDPSDDAELLRAARDHAQKLTVALAADEASLSQPHLGEGRAALAELIAALSNLTDSIDRTTTKSP